MILLHLLVAFFPGFIPFSHDSVPSTISGFV